MKTSRRRFLKKLGIGVGTAIVASKIDITGKTKESIQIKPLNFPMGNTCVIASDYIESKDIELINKKIKYNRSDEILRHALTANPMAQVIHVKLKHKNRYYNASNI